MIDTTRFKEIFKEGLAIMWQAAKETPRQMFAPFVAAWREIVKLSRPKY